MIYRYWVSGIFILSPPKRVVRVTLGGVLPPLFTIKGHYLEPPKLFLIVGDGVARNHPNYFSPSVDNNQNDDETLL
jgi:hypothetical protein